MNEQNIDYTKLMKVKCGWQSNVDGKDIENCVATYIQKFENKTSEM